MFVSTKQRRGVFLLTLSSHTLSCFLFTVLSGDFHLPLTAKHASLHDNFIYLFKRVVEAAISWQMCGTGSRLGVRGYVTRHKAVRRCHVKQIKRAVD